MSMVEPDVLHSCALAKGALVFVIRTWDGKLPFGFVDYGLDRLYRTHLKRVLLHSSANEMNGAY